MPAVDVTDGPLRFFLDVQFTNGALSSVSANDLSGLAGRWGLLSEINTTFCTIDELFVDRIGSLATFAAFAHRKNWITTLSVRVLRAPISVCTRRESQQSALTYDILILRGLSSARFFICNRHYTQSIIFLINRDTPGSTCCAHLLYWRNG